MTDLTQSTHVADAGARFVFGGDLSTAQRLAYGLAPLFQLLEARGHVAGDLLRQTGIPDFALEEPSYRISLEQELEFTRLALLRLGLADASLEVGSRFHLSMFGVLGLAAACAENLRSAFQLFLAYPLLVWGLIEITLWRTEESEYIAFASGEVAGELGAFFIERDMAALLMLFRNVLAREISPLRVEFAHPLGANEATCAVFFGCPVRSGSGRSEMHFDRAVWEARPPQANPMSRRLYENQCRSLSDALSAPFRYTDLVRARLRHATPVPSLETLAGQLYLTPRTLQRRLGAEGTGFTGLLREVRQGRARELLQSGEQSIEEIAFRLGFRSADAFSRAFRSWEGMAPTAFRRQRRRG